MLVSSAKGWRIPRLSAALSKRRSDVVPTAIIRLPAFLAAFMVSTASGVMIPYSACFMVLGVVGFNRKERSQAPTCSVKNTSWISFFS